MPSPPPRSADPRRTDESDQLPEEQPASTSGATDPHERKTQVGLDPEPDPGSRRNTGNPHEDDRAADPDMAAKTQKSPPKRRPLSREPN